MKKLLIVLAWVLFTAALTTPALALEKIAVAVAANYIAVFQELAADFEAKTKIKVEGTFSSTGNLYTQIANGAPYDLFLSADEGRPQRLAQDGLAEKPVVYARGQVILWSARKDFCQAANWSAALKKDGLKKIALANPVTAPYGAAAKVALQKAGLWDILQSKLVNAQDIAQSFQYASTSAVDAGFCSLSATASAAGKKGCFFVITEAPDIVQAACILKRTKNRAAAQQFADFLLSPEAAKIKMKYGYR